MTEIATRGRPDARGRAPGMATSATRVVASTAGVLAAYAGLEHAVGELRQGAVPIESVRFESWPDEPAFAMFAGEPAMSLLPIYQSAGIATAVVATTLGVWAVAFVQRRGGGWVLIALSVVLLLVGGGFGPPLLGTVAGIAGTRIGVVPARPPGRLLRTLGRLWGWLLALAVVAFLGLVPGLPLLWIAADVEEPGLVTLLSSLAFVSTLLAVMAARGHDRVEAAGDTSRRAAAEPAVSSQEGKT